MKKVTTLKKLFYKSDCYGWAWHVSGGKYAWHNDNDLSLLMDIDECTGKEIIIRKIKITDKGYLYILRNIYNVTDDIINTLPQIKAVLKLQHGNEMTKHEKNLAKKAGY